MIIDAADDTAVQDAPDEELERDLDTEDEGADGADDDDSGAADDGDDGSEGGTTDEVTITIGDQADTEEEDERKAPTWVRDLRKTNRQLVRELREKEEQLAQARGSSGQAAAIVIGPEPSMSDDGIDWDEDKFKVAWRQWNERKSQAQKQQDDAERVQQQAQADWQKRLEGYKDASRALKVSDFEDAEGTVKDTLSVLQQGIIINGAENAATLIYALGKNPKRLKEMEGIKDPVKFAFAVAKLETQLKIVPRKQAPTPDRVVRSTVTGSSAVDSELERLRKEAEKTGDNSKVMAYRRMQKDKQRA